VPGTGATPHVCEQDGFVIGLNSAAAAAAAVDQAFSIIRDGSYKLAASQKVTLGVVEPPVGNAGVCGCVDQKIDMY
jgi:hypothetical protein